MVDEEVGCMTAAGYSAGSMNLQLLHEDAVGMVGTPSCHRSRPVKFDLCGTKGRRSEKRKQTKDGGGTREKYQTCTPSDVRQVFG